MIDILKELCMTEDVSDTSDVSDTTSTDSGSQEGSSQETIQEPEVQESSYEIDGQSYSLDDIKNFKQSHESFMEQNAQYQRLQEESKEALELFNYLKGNEQLAKKMYEYDMELQGGLKDKMPSKESEMIRDMQTKINVMQIEKQLSDIKTKDSSVNEVQLLSIANQNNISLDLAYNVWRGMNYETQLKQSLEKQSKDLTNQIQNNAKVTKTMITESDNKPTDSTYGLSEVQLAMAQKLDMSPEEYAKWRS